MSQSSARKILSLVLAVALVMGLGLTSAATGPQGDFELTSAGVVNGRLLNEYGMHGSQFENVSGFQVPSRSMPLSWENAPAGTRSYAIYVDDITVEWTHWMAVNIHATALPANASKSGAVAMVQGRNDFGSVGYGGPTPPSGTHQYDMTVFALDVDSVPLSAGYSETAFWDAILDHILDEVTITGSYGSVKTPDPEPEPDPIDPDEEYVLTLAAGPGGKISLGQSGVYKGGDLVQIGATPDEGYTFHRWTSDNGGTFQSAASPETTFTAPGGDVTVTASFTLITAPGGGSGGGSSSRSRGGSSGGSANRVDGSAVSAIAVSTGGGKSANVNADGSVNESKIKSEVEAAAKAGGSLVTVRTRNASSISPGTLRAMAAAAGGKNLVLHADTTGADNRSIQGRLYIEPSALRDAASPIGLGVYTAYAKVASTRKVFEQYFSNKFAVIAFDQVGSFGSRIHVAAMADLGGLDAGNLLFYSYDRGTNSFRLIGAPDYRIDSNGFVHFYTTQGGAVIITDQPLKAK